MTMKIQGYASVFNKIDSANDKILPGAFTKTLKLIKQYKHTIPIFADHNDQQTIGRVVKIEERKKGLWIEAEIFDLAAAERIKKFFGFGLTVGLSIGYKVISEKNYNQKHETYDEITDAQRNIESLHLIEISVVKFPANSHCFITRIL